MSTNTDLNIQTILTTQAENAAGVDAGWIMTAGVIIFFMQSGFALLESGNVRFKNYQNILLKNCLDACIGGIVWWAFGFAFAFGLQGDNTFIGTTYFLGTNLENEDAPGYGFWFFQFAFACTAATIVSGSLAERVNINNYILFSALMTGFIYPVVVAWTWGGGFLTGWGFSDFAGSGVVHLTGGISGLAGAIICGPRIGRFDENVSSSQVSGENEGWNSGKVDGYEMVYQKFKNKEWDILRVHEFIRCYVGKLEQKTIAPHSPQQAVLGTLILWLGWLFFNGGSSAALSGGANLDAERAMINTVLAPSAAGLLTFYTKKHITGENKDIIMDFQALTNGILAGLVAVTASCASIQPWAAVITGCIGSLTYSFACLTMNKLKIDDPLDAFQVHGACGFIGCITLAFFNQETGIIYGGKSSTEMLDGEEVKTIAGGELLGIQIAGCLVIVLWSGGMSAIFFFISNQLGYLRLSEKDEILGGDLHYFGPQEFYGHPNDYDLVETMQKQIIVSAKKAQEGDEDMEGGQQSIEMTNFKAD